MTTHKLRSELNAAVEECDRAQYELNVLHLQMKITRMAVVKVKQHVNRAMFADFATRHRQFRKHEAPARARRALIISPPSASPPPWTPARASCFTLSGLWAGCLTLNPVRPLGRLPNPDSFLMKLPSFPFYPGDWMKDPSLRRCSHAARGVWMDVLCLAFECDERGVLISGGRPWTTKEVATAVGGNADVALACIDELLAKGVAKTRADGAVYSKRMVEDEARRQRETERKRQQRAIPDDPQAELPAPSRASPAQKESVRPLSDECPGDVPGLSRVCPGLVPVLSHPSSSSSSVSLSGNEESEREGKMRAAPDQAPAADTLPSGQSATSNQKPAIAEIFLADVMTFFKQRMQKTHRAERIEASATKFHALKLEGKV